MKYRLKNLLYKLLTFGNLQFIKHSWLDLKRDKAKAIFCISGIAISLSLLTSIGMLRDTMNYNYMRLITNTTGASDILITKTVETDVTYDPFFDEDLIDEKLSDIEGVEEFFPRLMVLAKSWSENTDSNGTLFTYGIDFEAEAENGNMGNLLVVDEDGDETGEIYDSKPDEGECIVLWNAAELLEVEKEDIIYLEYEQIQINLTIVEVCIQEQKFMEFENALILINLEEAQEFVEQEGEINLIMGTIENPEYVYDASNVDGTTRKLREISARIQDRLDINEYDISLPKLEELESSQYSLMSMTIIFWFITLLSMLITGILIHSILSTSVEERVREFGITHVMGGKKIYIFKMVIFEGLLLGIIGSVIGVIAGILLTPYISSQLFAFVGSDFSEMEFIIQPLTIITALSIGTFVAMFVAFLPAIKASKLNLIKSITPFQTKEIGWEVKKEGSMNVKCFVMGLSIATIGLIFFVLLPRIFITGEFMLIAGLLIGLLAAILLGLVFASIGIIPLVQKLFFLISKPFVKKYASIVSISLKRYRRRNTSTVVMFSISFSFIFFLTGVNEMESENLALTLRFQYGADLVIVNQGLDYEDDAVTLEMVEELKELGGVEEVAYALHNTIDFQAALSMMYEASEGGLGYEESSSAEEQLRNLFQFYSTSHSKKFTVTSADISAHDEIRAGFIGVDEDFIELIDKDLVIWSSPESSDDYSFNEMLEEENTCILAKSIANILGVDEVGEEIRLTFYNPQIENDPGNATLFEVVGISGGIPGFWNFRSNENSAYGGGVLISLDTYKDYMAIDDDNMIIDKIFINLRDSSDENIENTKDDIRNRLGDYNFIIDDAASKINFIEEMNERQTILMEIILGFTMVICIFGLISTMYAIMLERKLEVGILRSMGMKAKNVRNMFLLESMIIMLSAGIMGTIIGTFCAYLLETNMGLITEMPTLFVIPIATLLRVFITSVLVGIAGMYLILMKLSKQSIMDIFRQTF